jgi:hypothetical protein
MLLHFVSQIEALILEVLRQEELGLEEQVGRNQGE